jgi:hypothetical protein
LVSCPLLRQSPLFATAYLAEYPFPQRNQWIKRQQQHKGYLEQSSNGGAATTNDWEARCQSFAYINTRNFSLFVMAYFAEYPFPQRDQWIKRQQQHKGYLEQSSNGGAATTNDWEPRCQSFAYVNTRNLLSVAYLAEYPFPQCNQNSNTRTILLLITIEMAGGWIWWSINFNTCRIQKDFMKRLEHLWYKKVRGKK